MTPDQFCYWLRGFFELTEANNNSEKITLTKEQVEMINRHLESVFTRTIMETPPSQLVPFNFPPTFICGSETTIQDYKTSDTIDLSHITQTGPGFIC